MQVPYFEYIFDSINGATFLAHLGKNNNNNNRSIESHPKNKKNNKQTKNINNAFQRKPALSYVNKDKKVSFDE